MAQYRLAPSCAWSCAANADDAVWRAHGAPRPAGRRRRGLIIDLDDTLYPHETFVRSGFVAVARHLQGSNGLSPADALATLSRARHGGGRGEELQILCANHGIPTSRVPELVNVFRTHRPSIELPRSSQAMLAEMRAEGWGLVILTNGLPSIQRAKVAALGVEHLVDAVVYAEEHAPGGKPDRAVFVEALRRLRVSVRDAVHAGDDPRCDIAGGRAAGLRTIHVTAHGAPVEGVDADAVIESLDDLPFAAETLLDTVTTNVA